MQHEPRNSINPHPLLSLAKTSFGEHFSSLSRQLWKTGSNQQIKLVTQHKSSVEIRSIIHNNN
jgi:hypothetical protein